MPPQTMIEQTLEGSLEDYLEKEEPDREDAPSSSSSSFAVSTTALCVGMLTHSYLLISVFPYSGYLAIELLEGVNEDNAGSYAGFLASSFMVGRAITSYAWGQAADTYGRTAVLYTSLGLSSIFSILFGIAPNFYLALFFRFCLGLSNGIMGTIKTVISELANGDEAKEARGMSIVVGMWGWGFLVSPVLSGALAEPVKQYPDTPWLQEGWISDILVRFPFLLCNLLGATMCLIGLTTVALLVRETLPGDKRRSIQYVGSDILRYLPSWIPVRYSRYDRLPSVVKKDSSYEFPSASYYDDDDEDDREIDAIPSKAVAVARPPQATVASILARPRTRICLSIYWLYSFVGLTVDETFPLFCISRKAGFGLSEKEIGKILSLCGLVFAISQYSVYQTVYNRFGLFGAIRTGTLLSAPIMFLVPLSLLLNRGVETGHVNWQTFLFLAVMMAAYRVFALVFFSSVSVAVNRTVPSTERATMNGLSVLGGSVAKALGPTFAGFLVSTSVSWLGKAGSVMMFSTIGLLGCFVVTSAFCFLHDEETKEEETDSITSIESEASIELTDSIQETRA